jgi:hypothetical protein
VTVAKKIQLGPVLAEPASDLSTRMAILLWGLATVGKSTFAATAPGHKLWLSFGDNEHVSIAHRKDVTVAPLHGLGLDDLFKHAQSDDPLGLDKALAENEHITTVVADSITALTFRALQKAVKDGVGASRNFKPSMEQPGKSAYGGRNGIVLETVTGLLRVTAKHGVHLILTAHEADASTKKDDMGNDIIDYVSVMLGGQLVNNMTYRLSEIWYMSESSGRRTLAVRPTRRRRPMKTRMFSGLDEPEFVLTYDADKPDKGQMTIASWYDKWADGGYEKISVPKGKAR